MKSILIVLLLILTTSAAMAVSQPVPNTELLPKASKATCTSLVAGRSTQASVAVTDTRLLNWYAFSATDGSVVVVKRFLASANTAYRPASTELLGIASTTTAVVFKRYSGNATVTLCYDKN